jgi:hypothetical protein
MDQIETCESFEVVSEGQQAAVRLVLAGGARGMSFLKAEEAEELEKALRERPELDHRRLQANGENSG